MREESKKRTISVVKKEISELSDLIYLTYDPRVRKLIDSIRKENEPKVIKLREELEQLEEKKRPPKPRWPDNTPKDVISFCEKYWKGTTEYGKFRIHCWNSKAIWTSYPGGTWSDNGGQHYGQATFDLISRTEKEIGNKAKVLMTLQGRTNMEQMQERLEELT